MKMANLSPAVVDDDGKPSTGLPDGSSAEPPDPPVDDLDDLDGDTDRDLEDRNMLINACCNAKTCLTSSPQHP